MRAFVTTITRAVYDFCYGVNAYHAMRHRRQTPAQAIGAGRAA